MFSQSPKTWEKEEDLKFFKKFDSSCLIIIIQDKEITNFGGHACQYLRHRKDCKRMAWFTAPKSSNILFIFSMTEVLHVISKS